MLVAQKHTHHRYVYHFVLVRAISSFDQHLILFPAAAKEAKTDLKDVVMCIDIES